MPGISNNPAGINRIFTTVILFFFGIQLLATDPRSVYTQRPNDPEAFYFTPDNYSVIADGKTDISDVLQDAINQVKKEKNFGILFIPEGKYLISKTIYIPGAIRLIGYGKKRPEFILGANSPGYQEEQPDNRGNGNYMFWFTGNLVEDGESPRDAGAGTFYSAMSNINLRIEKGNPYAIALRTHFAQHGFISHVSIYTGNGLAGLLDVGNEMENVEFFGGEYGIYTHRTSPGWPMAMVDTYFEGQRKAAIWTHEAGLAIFNMHVKNVPIAIEMDRNTPDRIFLENCIFENIGRMGIAESLEENSMSQLNLIDVYCKQVPVLLKNLESDNEVKAPAKIYQVKDLSRGLIMDDMASDSEYKTIQDIVPLDKLPGKLKRSIPELPSMESWVNIKSLGAIGDGETDDTDAFRNAIDLYPNIYVPQGWY
ncbi:MAG: glycosyl hydrolase family 28-related protein, partial [Bacteroidales bacterium]